MQRFVSAVINSPVMDPVSVVGLIQGSIGLAGQCLTIVKTLNDLAGQFKNAKLTIISLQQEVGTLQLAWKRIAEWSPQSADPELLEKLGQSLQCGDLVMSALQEDLLEYNDKSFGFRKRAKTAFNEKTLLDHQTRIRGQAQAMSFLLQVIEMQSPQDKKQILKRAERKIRDSQISAYSIVPSRLSSRVSQLSGTSQDRLSRASVESADLVYHRLSFEDELFTSVVYKRNYRARSRPNRRISEISNHVSHETRLQSPYKPPGSSTPMLPNSVDLPKESANDIERLYPDDSSSRLIRDSLVDVLQANVSSSRDSANKAFTVQLIPVLKEYGIQAAFHKAVEDLQYDHVMCLLAYGVRVDGRYLSDDCRFTALSYAVYKGDTAMTKLLLRFSAKGSVNATNLLQRNCIRSPFEMIVLLLDAGADVNSHDESGHQPLHMVCGFRTAPHIIRELVNRGANVDDRTTVGYRKTPLQLARGHCFNSNVKALIEMGAQDDTKAPQFASPLHAALISRSLVKVISLLDKGHDPNLRDPKNGLTGILLLASVLLGGFSETAIDDALFDVLLKHNADPKASDAYGNQILHFLVLPTWYARPWYTSKACVRRDLIRRLINFGADCNALDNKGQTPLYLAVLSLNVPLVEELLESGGHLLPSEMLRLRILLHEMHSKSFLRVSENIMSRGMSVRRDGEIHDMLRLLRGERGFLKPKMTGLLSEKATQSYHLTNNVFSAPSDAATNRRYGLMMLPPKLYLAA